MNQAIDAWLSRQKLSFEKMWIKQYMLVQQHKKHFLWEKVNQAINAWSNRQTHFLWGKVNQAINAWSNRQKHFLWEKVNQAINGLVNIPSSYIILDSNLATFTGMLISLEQF